LSFRDYKPKNNLQGTLVKIYEVRDQNER